MKYMLDTNVCIGLLKNIDSVVEQYWAKKHLGISISSIASAELYFGAYNSANVAKNLHNLRNFLLGPETLEFDDAAANESGSIRERLRRKGTPIGPLDVLIAAHAKSLGLVLVTNNTREFIRVEGLVIEDWLV